MDSNRTAAEVLDRDFPGIRHELLTIAAALDRIDRAKNGEHAKNDPRIEKIQDAIALLRKPGPNRAERVQMVFSRPYQADWQSG